MKQYVFIACMLATYVAVAQISPSENKVRFNRLVLTSPSSLCPFIEVTEAGVEYVLAFESQNQKDSSTLDINKPLKVTYKSTKSVHFKTEEGVSVANTYGDIKKYASLISAPGWMHYVCLPSGWCAVFYATEKPSDNQKIDAFFKKF